ncbi:MAG: U32 family peptidase [Oscillospiraceae bacterium]|nr:U32 family peptidase [Oscillospiraceae bacterium]
MIIPELLSPAGDRERLEAALMFGADAVYLGGDTFSMRAAPQNFDFEGLTEAVKLCHERGVKVYLACNTLPRNGEADVLPSYLERWQDIGVDAFIVADIGVLSLCKKHAPKIPVHISTQAGIVNYVTANEFYNMGASRVVMARELSLSEIAEIRAKTPKELEIECFVHGAMCVSFSGRCLLSNYLVDRDANRGECAQPCRWEYALMEVKRDGMYFPIDDSKEGTYILNSKDMCMIEHIPELVNAGISSFKIEGRAKSAYYAAVITNAYRAAIDGYIKNPVPEYKTPQWAIDECYKISYREYCTGFYFGHPNENAQISLEGGYKRHYDVVAAVKECKDGYIIAEQRNKFYKGDELDALMPGCKPMTFTAVELFDADGNEIDAVPHPMMTLKIKSDLNFPKGTLLRKEK